MNDRIPGSSPVWLFAYGSLIWRPSFAYAERVRGFVTGFTRRFWQGSTDHRGVVGAPGRVATLVPAPGDHCWGVAYLLDSAELKRTWSALDHREQGGYRRVTCRFDAKDRSRQGELRAITYVATEENPEYLGEAPLRKIAEQVRQSSGPSGHNAEYVLRLAESLLELNVLDEHVFELANLLSDPS